MHELKDGVFVAAAAGSHVSDSARGVSTVHRRLGRRRAAVRCRGQLHPERDGAGR